jgi:deoxyribodipyrimidine photo-lyase
VIKPINIVWFKRDLRFVDNDALFAALFRLAFIVGLLFEPLSWIMMMLMCAIWFVYESIQDLQKKLNPINATIYFFHNEVTTVFKELVEQYEIKPFFSHQEIGINYW